MHLPSIKRGTSTPLFVQTDANTGDITLTHAIVQLEQITNSPLIFQFGKSTRLPLINSISVDGYGHIQSISSQVMTIPSLSELIPYLGAPTSDSSFYNSFPLFSILGENQYSDITTSAGHGASAYWYHPTNTLIDTIGDPYRLVADGTSRPHTIRM